MAEQSTDPLDILADDLDRFHHDPLGWVLWAFPWGEPGGPLANETGPDQWQREQLMRIGERLRTDPHTPILELTVSGHGIGKSAQVAWLILWATTTAVDTKGVITANTALQLKTKTWAELAKWYNMLEPLLQEQFEKTATAIFSADPTRRETWRSEAIPNSPENPAAFAGAHNAGKRLLIIFDEASEIDEVIWETAEGALTDADTEIIFAVYGNPTQPIGRFKECATGRFRHRWTTRHIDNRTVKRTNKKVLQELIDTYGEDSDYVRVRVKGQFPRVGSVQLIPTDIVEAARKRRPLYVPSDPLILGVDCARFGDDQSVLAARRGLDAKSIPWERYRNIDTMALVTKIVEFVNRHGPDAVMVDDGSFGAAIIDRLQQMNIRNVYPVSFGGPGGTVQYGNLTMKVANTRASIWVKMRASLYGGLAIPDEEEIETDLTGVQYGYNGQEEIQLERKQDMKKRGLASPDNGDALACTYAYHIAPRAWTHPELPGSGSQGPRQGVHVTTDYDIYEDLR